MFANCTLSILRQRAPQRLFFIICALICMKAQAFDGISSTSSPLLGMAGFTFANTYSQWQTFSTVTEFRNVDCKHVKDQISADTSVRLISISEVDLQNALKLTGQLDDLQYDFCEKMIPSGTSTELTIKFGSAWKATLKTGSEVQRDLSKIYNNEDQTRQLINQYLDQVKDLQSIDNFDGSEK